MTKDYKGSISNNEARVYGYSWNGMLPVDKESAIELYQNGNIVFLLYPDNTEAMVGTLQEIENHDGIFGIEKP